MPTGTSWETSGLESRLARLEVHVEVTRADVAEIKGMVMELRDARNRGRGAGLALTKLIGAAGLIMAVLGWLTGHWPKPPR